MGLTKLSNAARQALVDLHNAHGDTLTPHAVVEAARPQDSPLHPHFEWDDVAAGEKHREGQARALIRTVRLIVTTRTQTITVPSYVRDPTLPKRAPGYVTTASMRTDADKARELLRAEVRRIEAHIDRVRGLARALELSDELETMLAGLLLAPAPMVSGDAATDSDPAH